MTNFTLLHAADLHLGRPFSGLERSGPHLADLFRRAGRTAWERIVETAIARKVDALTLAGDVFDSGNPSVRARVAFRDGIQRLYEEGIPVFLAAGNHDPLSTFSDSLKNLPGLHLFGPEPEGSKGTWREITDGVVIYGAGFEKAAAKENLAVKFRRDPGAEVAVGVLHTNVSNTSGHRDYAPCTQDDLTAAGMDAWCLGHVHTAAILRDYPLILYPGTSQGARMEETGPRGCYFVTLRTGNEAHAEFLPTAPVRWETLHPDVTEACGEEELVSLVESACADLFPEDDSVEALVVGITLTGRPMDPLDRKGDLIPVLAERLEQLPIPVFLGSLRDITRSPLNLESLGSGNGFIGDFLRLCRSTSEDAIAVRDLTALVRTELLRKVGGSHAGAAAVAEVLSSEEMPPERLLDEAGEMAAEMFFDLECG